MSYFNQLTRDQIAAYYEARCDQLSRSDSKGQVTSRCPFHDDRVASLSLNLETGRWTCHAGCGSGHLLEFELKLSGGDQEQARQTIASLCGITAEASFQSFQARYEYADESGHPLYTVSRIALPGGKKTFRQGHKGPDGAWIPNMEGVRRVLYHLREVVGSQTVWVTEGEKDADRLRSLFFGKADPRVAARLAFTTNSGGAGKWDAAYAPYFTGKDVVVFADNDDVGRSHALTVAASVYPYAHRMKLVHLPVPVKGDVSDYLESHSPEELLALLKSTPLWEPVISSGERFPNVVEFVKQTPQQIDWLVENIIQRGANGFMVGNPKAGKSFTITDLSLALASGMSFLGHLVPRRVRVAHVAREDTPGLTGYRYRHLMAGRGMYPEESQDWIYVNTRASQRSLYIDHEQDLLQLIADLKRVRAEFTILDVFNKLHSADENDNTEMRRVLDRVTRIQDETGSAICVVHHFNKTPSGAADSITARIRGASAVAGFVEFVIAIELVDKVARVRCASFEQKADEAAPEVFFRIDSSEKEQASILTRLPDYVRPAVEKRLVAFG